MQEVAHVEDHRPEASIEPRQYPQADHVNGVLELVEIAVVLAERVAVHRLHVKRGKHAVAQVPHFEQQRRRADDGMSLRFFDQVHCKLRPAPHVAGTEPERLVVVRRQARLAARRRHFLLRGGRPGPGTASRVLVCLRGSDEALLATTHRAVGQKLRELAEADPAIVVDVLQLLFELLDRQIELLNAAGVPDEGGRLDRVGRLAFLSLHRGEKRQEHVVHERGLFCGDLLADVVDQHLRTLVPKRVVAANDHQKHRTSNRDRPEHSRAHARRHGKRVPLLVEIDKRDRSDDLRRVR